MLTLRRGPCDRHANRAKWHTDKDRSSVPDPSSELGTDTRGGGAIDLVMHLAQTWTSRSAVAMAGAATGSRSPHRWGSSSPFWRQTGTCC